MTALVTGDWHIDQVADASHGTISTQLCHHYIGVQLMKGLTPSIFRGFGHFQLEELHSISLDRIDLIVQSWKHLAVPCTAHSRVSNDPFELCDDNMVLWIGTHCESPDSENLLSVLKGFAL
jgi:hypothetical protein